MIKTIFLLMAFFSCSLIAAAQDDYHKFEVSGGYSYERAEGFPGDTFVSTSPLITSTSTTGADRKHNLNGFEASAVYNFSRYFGAKFDFSGHFGSDENHTLPGGVYREANNITILVIPDETGISARQRDYKYMGGLQFKDNSKTTKFKPFAHALFGAARQTTDFPDLDQERANINGGRKISSNSFTMAFGGGLDVRVSKHIDIRVFQFDYNPVFTKEKTLIANGSQVDTTITILSGGSTVTTLQDVRIPKNTQQNFRIGFGIVFH